MISSESKIRVRYCEVDQMGYLHHSRYAQYYEVARTELIHKLSLSYAELEKDGIMMPLIDLNCKYIAPALYDQELTVKVILKDVPNVRTLYHYEVYNEDKKMINTGSTTIVFVSAETRRPCRPPKHFMEAVLPYFETEEETVI